MRTYIAPFLMGSVLLLGSAAAYAAPRTAPTNAAGFLLAANDDWAAKKQDYETRAQVQLDEWRRRMDALTAEAKAKSQEYSADARRKLDRAWAETKAEWAKLKQASADNWDKARASFEDATARMKRALNDVQSKNQ